MATGRRGEQTVMFDATGAVAPPAKKARKRRRGVALGRKPRAERVGFVPHARREEHDRQHPVHVSMRRVKLAPSFRSDRVFRAILGQLARAKRGGVRVVHYSVQHDHLHLSHRTPPSKGRRHRRPRRSAHRSTNVARAVRLATPRPRRRDQASRAAALPRAMRRV